jgi:hypothetical protein
MTVQVGVDTEVPVVMAAIESYLEEGSVGVALEPSVWGESERSGATGSAAAEVISQTLISAAAHLTAVTVTVDSHEQAESALQAGATGIMVQPPMDARSRAVTADRGGRLWLTGVTDPPDAGPVGERLVLECSVVDVARLARLLDSGRAPVAEARIACSLPSTKSVDDGALEALVTLAVAGGATVLRCASSVGRAGRGDVRVVRRCADVAMELLRSEAALGYAMPGGQGVAS